MPTITRLTEGGCCREPVWHPDGSRVLYADAMAGQQYAVTYAVPAAGGGRPTVFWNSVGIVSPDGARIAFPDFAARVTRVQEFGKMSIATLDNDLAYVSFSRDGRQVMWLERQSPQASSNTERVLRVWTANADGTNARVRVSGIRANDLQWLPDGQRFLYSGRDANGTNPGIYLYDLSTSTATRLAATFSARGLRLAPDGKSVVYLAVLETTPEANGLFHLRLDTGERRKLPLLGGVRWLPDSSSIIVVPTQTDGGADALVRVDAATLAVTPLTSRTALPFRIAQDQWQLSPDGTRIVYVSLDDTNIYVLRFAP